MVRMFLAIGKPCRLQALQAARPRFLRQIPRPVPLRAKGSRSLFRDDSALSIEFNLVHTVVSQLDQVAPVFATFGL